MVGPEMPVDRETVEEKALLGMVFAFTEISQLFFSNFLGADPGSPRARI
jgi:hypothetical protein